MENNLLHIDILGNSHSQIRRNKILQLISISLFTLSVILSCKLLLNMLFPGMPHQYSEMSIIIASCLAVNIAASLILYKYREVLQHLEERLEIKTDNLANTIKNLRMEREESRRNKANLQRSAAKYRALMENSGEGIIFLDFEKNFLEANKKMKELLGFSETELLAMNLAQVLPEGEIERTLSALEEVSQTGTSHLTNGWLIRKDLERVPVDFTGNKVEYDGKTILQVIFRDLTERQTG